MVQDLVPHSYPTQYRLYMWLRVLLTSRSLFSLPCNALHAEFYTSASSPTLFLVVSLNYLSAPSQLHLDYSRSTRSAFPSKFYYLAPYYHPSIQLDFCPRGPPSFQKSFQSIWLENSGFELTLSFRHVSHDLAQSVKHRYPLSEFQQPIKTPKLTKIESFQDLQRRTSRSSRIPDFHIGCQL